MTTTPPAAAGSNSGSDDTLAFLYLALCLALVKEHRRRVRAEATIDAIEQWRWLTESRRVAERGQAFQVRRKSGAHSD